MDPGHREKKTAVFFLLLMMFLSHFSFDKSRSLHVKKMSGARFNKTRFKEIYEAQALKICFPKDMKFIYYRMYIFLLSFYLLCFHVTHVFNYTITCTELTTTFPLELCIAWKFNSVSTTRSVD